MTNDAKQMTNDYKKLKLDELNRASVEEFKEQEKLPVIVVPYSVPLMVLQLSRYVYAA
jgi:D-alanine-D-alanine ligase-like ATP-grasp enzyme